MPWPDPDVVWWDIQVVEGFTVALRSCSHGFARSAEIDKYMTLLGLFTIARLHIVLCGGPRAGRVVCMYPLTFPPLDGRSNRRLKLW